MTERKEENTLLTMLLKSGCKVQYKSSMPMKKAQIFTLTFLGFLSRNLALKTLENFVKTDNQL